MLFFFSFFTMYFFWGGGVEKWGKGPFTRAIFVAATQCNFCRAEIKIRFSCQFQLPYFPILSVPSPRMPRTPFNMADAGSGLREFTTDISLYEKGRPDYTEESVEFLLNRVGVLPRDKKGPMKLLEIASGTGKFTRAMAKVLAVQKANVEIIASDSQEAMCDRFRNFVPGIHVHHFPAENIGKTTNAIIKIRN